MRTILSALFVAYAATATAASFGPEVPLTATPPVGFAQELPAVTLTANGPVVLWREGTTRAALDSGQPVDPSRTHSLDPVGFRDGAVVTSAHGTFAGWVENDWVYAVILDANGNPTAAPVLYDQVDSRSTMRMTVGASRDNFLVVFPTLSAIMTTMIDGSGNQITWLTRTYDEPYAHNIEKVSVASDGDQFLLVWEATTAMPWLTPCDIDCPNENREIHSMILGSDGLPRMETDTILATDAGMPEVVWNGHEYLVVWTAEPDKVISGRTVSADGMAAGPLQTFSAAGETGPHIVWDGAAYVMGSIHLPDQTLSVRRISTDGTVLSDSGTLLSGGAFPRQYALAVRSGKIVVTYVSGARIMTRTGVIATPRSRAVRR